MQKYDNRAKILLYKSVQQLYFINKNKLAVDPIIHQKIA